VLLPALVFLGSGGTPRAHFSCSHSLMVCLASWYAWRRSETGTGCP
jgi:hypothetical protein